MARHRKKGVHRLPRSVVRRRNHWNCPLDHKLAYTYKVAAKVARGLDDPQRPYWCPAAGGYHVTRLGVGEYDRRRQEFLPTTMDRETTMRVLVTGSRGWDDTETIWGALDAVAAEAAAAGATELVVVHGNHRPPMKNGRYRLQSADHLADMWANRSAHPLPVRAEQHSAKWTQCVPECRPGHRKRRPDGSTYCPGAGLRRNAEMVALGADRALAFIINGSPGSTNCAMLAERAGIPVERFEVPGPRSTEGGATCDNAS